jgi:hypothetical protein
MDLMLINQIFIGSIDLILREGFVQSQHVVLDSMAWHSWGNWTGLWLSDNRLSC